MGLLGVEATDCRSRRKSSWRTKSGRREKKLESRRKGGGGKCKGVERNDSDEKEDEAALNHLG